jgi:hypothetical protein
MRRGCVCADPAAADSQQAVPAARSSTTPAGRLVLCILGMINECQREPIIEGTRMGLEAAVPESAVIPDSLYGGSPPRSARPGNLVLSLLCGLRTEEARALRWAHVDLDGDPAASPPVPPHVAVWRSVRVHGETKTERSRRTLGLPAAAVQALRAWSASRAGERLAAGDGWQDTGLVFTSHHGAALDAGNVRKMFKRICAEAGTGDGWTPRELRTTFVSLMSHQGVAIEEIARLAGHATTRTTEIVYRRELRPRHHHRRRDHGPALHPNLALRAGPRTAKGPAHASRRSPDTRLPRLHTQWPSGRPGRTSPNATTRRPPPVQIADSDRFRTAFRVGGMCPDHPFLCPAARDAWNVPCRPSRWCPGASWWRRRDMVGLLPVTRRCSRMGR